MDSINEESQKYFKEEIHQFKVMLKGVLNMEYREHISKKLALYEHVLNLLRKEELQCKENIH